MEKYPHELYWTILNHISDAVFLLNQKKNFYFICPNAHVIFGYTYKEFQKFNNLDFILGRDFIDYDLLSNVGELSNIKKEIIDKYNKKHTLLINLKKVDIEQGRILITCRDISDINLYNKPIDREIFKKYPKENIESIKKGNMYISMIACSELLHDVLIMKFHSLIIVARNSESNHVNMLKYSKANFTSEFLKDLSQLMKRQKTGIICIRNLCYIDRMLGFDSLINLVFQIEIIISNSDFPLFLEIDENYFQPSQLIELISNFNIVDFSYQSRIKLMDKLILKFIDEKQEINMNSISKKFKIARLTARRSINFLEKEGYIECVKMSREKLIKISKRGMLFLQLNR